MIDAALDHVAETVGLSDAGLDWALDQSGYEQWRERFTTAVVEGRQLDELLDGPTTG